MGLLRRKVLRGMLSPYIRGHGKYSKVLDSEVGFLLLH